MLPHFCQKGSVLITETLSAQPAQENSSEQARDYPHLQKTVQPIPEQIVLPCGLADFKVIHDVLNISCQRRKHQRSSGQVAPSMPGSSLALAGARVLHNTKTTEITAHRRQLFPDCNVVSPRTNLFINYPTTP